jgi:hypothetical protein
MMKRIDRIAKAVLRLTREHGAPNSFAALEVATEAAGRITAKDVGYEFTKRGGLTRINETTGGNGAGIRASYNKRDGISWVDVEAV